MMGKPKQGRFLVRQPECGKRAIFKPPLVVLFFFFVILRDEYVAASCVPVPVFLQYFCGLFFHVGFMVRTERKSGDVLCCESFPWGWQQCRVLRNVQKIMGNLTEKNS